MPTASYSAACQQWQYTACLLSSTVKSTWELGSTVLRVGWLSTWQEECQSYDAICATHSSTRFVPDAWTPNTFQQACLSPLHCRNRQYPLKISCMPLPTSTAIMGRSQDGQTSCVHSWTWGTRRRSAWLAIRHSWHMRRITHCAMSTRPRHHHLALKALPTG